MSCARRNHEVGNALALENIIKLVNVLIEEEK